MNYGSLMTDAKPIRLTSLDAYRGFVMLLMASEGLGFGTVSRAFPDSGFWKFLAYQTDHVAWQGCALWDLIQPSFSFMVGVALPFSIANRAAKGESRRVMFLHALWRSLLLAWLGIFLRSTSRTMTNFTFEDTLTQIGLGYPILFLLGWVSVRTQAISAAVILFGYWLAFALYPLPPAGFDYASVGVPATWEHLTGFAAHWDKNTNLAAAFDHWFLNLFAREKPFAFNGGGYLTLSFIPTLGTMILGLLAGNVMKSDRTPAERIKWLLAASAIGFVSGTILDATGICPSVKRIWTPAWALFSSGWCFLFLATFYWVIDVKDKRGWAFPLIVVGMNSIAMYCMAHLIDGFLRDSLKIHLGQNIFKVFGAPYAPIVQHGSVLLLLWLILLWMYRRKIFLKI